MVAENRLGSRIQIRGKMIFKSIFERLFWTQVIVLLLVFAIMSTAMAVFVFNYSTQNQYERVIEASDAIEKITVNLHIENNSMLARSIYRDMLSMWSDIVNSDIIITTTDGTVFASTNTITSVPSAFAKKVSDGAVLENMNNFGGYYDEKVYTVGVPLIYNKTIIGCVFFNTLMPNLHKTVTEILVVFLLISSITIILAFVVVYFQSRKISRPIKSVNKAVLEIASGKYDHRVAVTTKDELGQLASSFNFMADSIQRLEEMRNSFISDVSHELRTPMTSISGFISGILDKTIPPEEEEKYLRIVLEESQRLTKLVNDMLDVSKMENAQYSLDVTEFDINELIRLCIIQLGQRIDDKQLELEVDFSADVLNVLADKDSIRRVLINLIDNAIKFSYENTTMKIKAWKESKKILVSVANHGAGIEEENLRYVFDRFYKTDKSRNEDKKGAGLGLSLVQKIISCHKQSIWVDSVNTDIPNTKLTTFTFTLEKA